MKRVEVIGSLAAVGAAATMPALMVKAAEPPDHVITIEQTSWEVRRGLVVRTLSFGGIVPGKLLRVREGSRTTVEVRNRTAIAQSISWHGMVVPDWVDGLATPDVPPRGARTYTFTATPTGTRFYHSFHGGGMFTGLFGPLIVEPKSERGDYDREVVLVLHEFEHTIPTQGSMRSARPSGSPTLSSPVMNMMGANTMGGGMMDGAMMGGMMRGGMQNMLIHPARYAAYAVNGKALGAGDPIRVKRGERVRLRVINASATLTHRLAFPGHRFLVTHLDGNAVPRPRTLDAIELGVGERVDAVVTMNEPGIWILGSTQAQARQLGLGVVIAYDGEHGKPLWRDGARDAFRYQDFSAAGDAVPVEKIYDLTLSKSPIASDAWSINGQTYPHTPTLRVQSGKSYLIRFSNKSMLEHPMHILGNEFTLARVDGVPTLGIRKDVVVVRPMMGQAEILFRANNPHGGRFLLMCHNWQHMKGGLASLLEYV